MLGSGPHQPLIDPNSGAIEQPAERQLPREQPERLTRKDGAKSDALEVLRVNGGKDGAPQAMVDAADAAGRKMRREDRKQLEDYTVWWFDTMASGADPLRDRMTLFWHGYFTSSMDDVKSSYQMIEQNRFLRAGALGSFRDLLHGAAKDPAMLEYLDNDENKKQEPNENFAREVMELFTLGEGNYTEDDIKEAARAFTGWRSRKGAFDNRAAAHDTGKKTVLGVTGKHDGDDVLEILLDQEACALHVAGKLLAYFEGRAPAPERLASYAADLRANEYDLEPLLRRLFADPEFYSDRVVGQRVAGPIDYLVGMSMRLDLTPPEAWYLSGSRLLGQRLFHPPTVKGWDGGMAWITTASLMQRGNLAGILVGTVDAGEVLSDQDEMFSGEEMMDDMEAMGSMDETPTPPVKGVKFGALSGLKAMSGRWEPDLDLRAIVRRSGATTAEETVDFLADLLLAVEVGPETRALLLQEFEAARPTQGRDRATGRARFRERGGFQRAQEDHLRGFAHLVLSLPEAQLN